MSYFSRLSFVSALLVLTACSPGKPIQTSTNWDNATIPDPSSLYQQDTLNMLQIGRAASGNSVDIYDPDARQLHVLPPERAVPPPQGSVPYNHMIVTRSKNVRVYSVDITGHAATPDQAKAVPTVEPKPVASPVPLKGQ